MLYELMLLLNDPQACRIKAVNGEIYFDQGIEKPVSLG
jgi:hypothetical protein